MQTASDLLRSSVNKLPPDVVEQKKKPRKLKAIKTHQHQLSAKQLPGSTSAAQKKKSLSQLGLQKQEALLRQSNLEVQEQL